MDIKIDSSKIQLGMYVSELDRPWEDTSFMFQGFLIDSEEQIKELQAQCSYIIVSQEKSAEGLFKIDPIKTETKHRSSLQNAQFTIEQEAEVESKNTKQKSGGLFSSIKQIGKELLAFKNPSIDASALKSALTIQQEQDELVAEVQRKQEVKVIHQHFIGQKHTPSEFVDYEIKTSVEEELISAKKSTERFEHEMASSFMLEMTGTDLSDRIDVAKELLSDVVESIIRNPNAMLLISNLKTLDHSHYRHALDVSIMLVSFGRQLGIPKAELNDIALGGLLHDIGKSKVPNEIIKKPQRLNASEFEQARMHVAYGSRIVDDIQNIQPITREIIERHHERYDGKGYPEQLSGEKIGLYGSMAGIVETYATITANQPYAAARSSAKAVSVLVALRGKAFQSELVDQFIQVVGVYPIGSIVQLSSGEIGIVTRQNKLWRLKPLVTIILDANGQKLKRQTTIDLARENVDEDDSSKISIVNELPSGSYGIDPKDYFI